MCPDPQGKPGSRLDPREDVEGWVTALAEELGARPAGVATVVSAAPGAIASF
jgi:hypothetical protein